MGTRRDRRARAVSVDAARMREIERWIAWVRVAAVPFAILQVTISTGYPPGFERRAWAITGILAVGTALLLWLSRRELSDRAQRALALYALAFDAVICSAYVLTYYFQLGTPIRQLLFLPLVEAALRYGIAGAVLLAVATTPVIAVYERLRSVRSDEPYDVSNVSFQVGVEILMGLIMGWLVRRLRRQTELAGARAAEAEQLRDALGRRVDLLEAANRCARALGSSLELEQAFSAFIRELRGLVPFERTAIILAEDGAARVIAAAGAGADDVFPPGTERPVSGSVLERVLDGETVYRGDMADAHHPEEAELLSLGLRSRLAAPLLVGPRAIGMISIARAETDAFAQDDIELVSLLGRLVGTAVQNIRAYEAERNTVGELRRLSALRADFVSLVSHELRSPMAAVIGASRTLQQRWRELSPDQRESFLALIADETTRLASLISDVLDTSRIEAGTFSFTFTDVDLGSLVREVAAAAEIGQDEVRVHASVSEPLPAIRGDRERLRQVLMNLIDNAVKYSPAGDQVEVAATSSNGAVRVDVRDRGPGIPAEQQKLIFEKFGRAKGGGAKPGTGLGLFIARSIVEAHGGTLDVRSAPRQGATFTVSLPVDSRL